MRKLILAFLATASCALAAPVTPIDELEVTTLAQFQFLTAGIGNFDASGNLGLLTVSPHGNLTYAGSTLDTAQNLLTSDSPSFSTLTLSVATGTAPLVITSTTQVNNLDAQYLGGVNKTWATPPAIGNTTPSTAAFTTLSASGTSALTGNVGVGGASNASFGLLINSTLSPGITGGELHVTGTITVPATGQIFGVDIGSSESTGTSTGFQSTGLRILPPTLTGTGSGILGGMQIAPFASAGPGPATIGNSVEFIIGSSTVGTNNADIIFGSGASTLNTATFPSGNVGIYQQDTYPNTLAGVTSFTNTTNSTNNSTGAVVVTGGLGVGQAATIGSSSGYSYGAPVNSGWAALGVPAAVSYTLTGTSGVMNFATVYFGGSAYTNSSANTITNLATLMIAGAPSTLGSQVGTNKYAMDVLSGTSIFNGLITAAAGVTASGSTANDLSGSSGAFKTSTGAVTIGPGAVTISGATTHTAATTFDGTATTTAVTISPTVSSTAISIPYLKINIPANTAQATTAEAPGLQTVTAIKQWTAGTVAMQREYNFVAPTYAQTAGGTFTEAATFVVGGAPISGTNSSITTDDAVLIQATSSTAGAGTAPVTTNSLKILNQTGGSSHNFALQVGTAGNGITNIRYGTSGAMTSGAVTVSDTGATASTRYFLTAHALGTVSVPSAYYVSARSAGTSFTITASAATDTSTIDWMAVEP